MKRVLSILLPIILVVSLLTIPAYAAETVTIKLENMYELMTISNVTANEHVSDGDYNKYTASGPVTIKIVDNPYKYLGAVEVIPIDLSSGDWRQDTNKKPLKWDNAEYVVKSADGNPAGQKVFNEEPGDEYFENYAMKSGSITITKPGSYRIIPTVWAQYAPDLLLVVTGGGLSVSDTPSQNPRGTTERLWGDNRNKTAAAISKNGWNKADSVILVDSNNFPDALVGSSFAYLQDAPILVTPADKLDTDTEAEIKRLGAKNVYILGSYDSISKSIEDGLKQNYNVIRIGGKEVFDTAVKIGEEVRKIKQFDTVAIATQNDFPDALAIASYSAKNTMPILFSEKDKLRTDTKKALQDWAIKNVVIAGGNGVVSDAVESELKAMGINVVRLWGGNRYATAFKIAGYFDAKNEYKTIALATGENYADALTGAVFAAKKDIPIVLVNNETLDSDTLNYLKTKQIDRIYIFGGIGVVSDNAVSEIRK